MDRLRISNLRCLKDTGMINLKPISLLVGANSSGKSSFLRTFPLLRQSAETKTLSGLLLNEGDVNFGFFDEALHKNADPAELRIEFGVEIKSILYHGVRFNSFIDGSLALNCELSYAKRSKDQHYPYFKSVRLILTDNIPNDRIEITGNEDGKITVFKVNGYDALADASHLKIRVGRGIIPTLIRVVDDDLDDGSLVSGEEIWESTSFNKKLISLTYNLFHGKTSAETRLATLRTVTIGTSVRMLASMKSIGSSFWKKSVSLWNEESPEFLSLRDLLLAKSVNTLLNAVSIHVTELARSVNYFAPVRANVERDYLSRDVAVGNVDPAGINVAMVLAALSTAELKNFQSWMQKHFGFDIYPRSVADGARIALRMSEENSGNTFNLADMGFGFSQMLPFLVQIWLLVIREPSRNRNLVPWHRRALQRSFIVAIEQPELHLHPALQAKLADLFVATAKLGMDKGVPVRFFLETHSPVIIERIGALIENKNIDSDHVQVLLFEKNRELIDCYASSVRSVKFDENGVLQDWPYGFLSAPSLPFPPAVG